MFLKCFDIGNTHLKEHHHRLFSIFRYCTITQRLNALTPLIGSISVAYKTSVLFSPNPHKMILSGWHFKNRMMKSRRFGNKNPLWLRIGRDLFRVLRNLTWLHLGWIFSRIVVQCGLPVIFKDCLSFIVAKPFLRWILLWDRS